MPIFSDPSSQSGNTIPLQTSDIERLLRSNQPEAVAYKAYQLDPGFRRAYDHYSGMNDLDEQTKKRLPELLLNRYYFKKWERHPVNELTAIFSQGPQDTQPKGYLGRVEARIQKNKQNVLRRTEEFHQGKRELVDTVIPNAANIFSGVVAPVTEAIDTGIGYALEQTGVTGLIQKAAETETGQRVIGTATDLYGRVKEAAPQELETFESVGKALFEGSEIVGAGQLAKLAGKGVKAGAEQTAVVAKKLTGRFPKDFDEAVAQGVAKGIKPQFRGSLRNSATSLQEYNKKASEAVRQIIERQNSFQYIDDAGDVVSQGAAPTNLSEFAQAIQQTKRQIFDEYSALTRQATGQGMSVDLDDIVDKLITYADDPVKQAADPSKAQYALKMAQRLSKQRKFNPTQTEQLIKELNESLAPTYADKAAKGISEVDLSVANALREKLDDVVVQSTGKEYQSLKNAYGALKTIEKDVGHRALIVARQNTKGIADLSDIFTGGDLVAGIMTANPAFIARGAAGYGIKEVYKKLVSPDANIMRMFRSAGRAYRRTSGAADDLAQATGPSAASFGTQASTQGGKGVASSTDTISNSKSVVNISDDALKQPSKAYYTIDKPNGEVVTFHLAPEELKTMKVRNPTWKFGPDRYAYERAQVKGVLGKFDDDMALETLKKSGATEKEQVEQIIKGAQNRLDDLSAIKKLTPEAVMKRFKVGQTVDVPITKEFLVPPKDIPADSFWKTLAKRKPPRMSSELAGPITATTDNGKLRIVDGIHRLGEALRKGEKTINVEIIP